MKISWFATGAGGGKTGKEADDSESNAIRTKNQLCSEHPSAGTQK